MEAAQVISVRRQYRVKGIKVGEKRVRGVL